MIAFHAVQPTLKEWSNSVSQSGGGAGVFILVLAVGILGWIWGKTTLDGPTSGQTPGANPSGAGGAGPGNTNHGQQHHGPPPNGFPNGAASPGSEKAQWGPNSGAHGYSQRQYHSSPPPTEPGTTGFDSNTRSPPNTNASSSWQKAREETRKREEERRRAEELKKKQEEERKTKEAAEAQARASAEKERWEKLRAREKEAREREARERLARERMAKEKAEREAKEKSQRDKLDQEARLKAARERAEKLARERAESAKAESQKAQSERATPTYGVGERTNPYSLDDSPAGPKSTIGVSSTPKPTSPGKPYQHPTAQSYAGTATETAFRPYDTPPRPKPAKSQSSFYSTYSPSYAPSESTARTSPPPSHATGPYFTSDPEKVVIRGAFKFTDLFPKPVAAVKPGEDGITDGLIMRVSTEGVFLDDDKKKEALRQWDIKAWTMKGIEVRNIDIPVCFGLNVTDLQPVDHKQSWLPYCTSHDSGPREYKVRLLCSRFPGIQGAFCPEAPQRRLVASA